MKVGCDDEASVYLNGTLAYQCWDGRRYVADEDVAAEVELKAGINVVVFKVVNNMGDWIGSVRFTDREGRPLADLTVTLEPGPQQVP